MATQMKTRRGSLSTTDRKRVLGAHELIHKLVDLACEVRVGGVYFLAVCLGVCLVELTEQKEEVPLVHPT